MIAIDGSQGEGGGQVLRTSLAMSILTRQPVHLRRIRAGRSKPGLAAQHLAGVLAAAEICGAEVSRADIGSTELVFTPGGPAQPGDYLFDISKMAGRGSAGATTLILQAILLPLALANGPSSLAIRGGTHVPWSPPAHYVQHVLLPVLGRAGLEASMETTHWGWFPRGGGEIHVAIAGGAKLRGVDLSERGKLTAVEGLAAASGLPPEIPQRIASLANNRLRESGLPTGVLHQQRDDRHSAGVGVCAAAVYENTRAGFNSLGEKGKPSPVVADEVIDALLAFHEQPAALDMHLTDQLFPALALAQGESRLTSEEITLHTLTNIAVIRQFIDRGFEVTGREGEPGTIIVTA